MQNNKKPLLSFPKIKEDNLHIPKILAHQIKPINPQSTPIIKSKTESFSPILKNDELLDYYFLNNQDYSPRQRMTKYFSNNEFEMKSRRQGKEVSKQSKKQISVKANSISNIIDTRKSIKILIQFYNSKIQQAKNRNLNCYHSPKRNNIGILELNDVKDDNSYVGKERFNYKRLRNKQKKLHLKTENNSPVQFKKYKPSHLQTSLIIENVMIAQANREKEQRIARRVLCVEHVPKNPKVNHKKSQNSGLCTQKNTQINGWRSGNTNDTHYIMDHL